MYRKLRKIAAAVLTAAMLTQQCVVPAYAESELTTESQAVTESQTAAQEKQAEEQTPAGTESQPAGETQTAVESQPAEQTQAAAEGQPAGETPTAAESQMAEQTQSETEDQNQPSGQTQPASEEQPSGQTQSQTAAETQTDATESETQTELQTEEQTKEQETEKLSETETERSQRVNGGQSLTLDTLVAKLRSVLTYLFVAETISAPEGLLDDQKIAEGSTGKALAAGLTATAVGLADAKTSSDVGVINIYADADGRLDTAQLKAAFSDQVIDVTNRYYVVNIIADSPDQNLVFSGYGLRLAGQMVDYTEETQAGDIVYNFAAMDGDSFTGYQGTLTLNGDLQGTFLAPQASVKISGSLAGAVYAESVTVQDSVSSLLRIAFATGMPQEEAAAAVSETAETGNEPPQVSETESEPADAAETKTETAVGKETETETETETAAGKETETETGTETADETETETGTENETASERESETAESGLIAEIESETSDDGADSEAESETESETGMGVLDQETEPETESQRVSVEFTVSMRDGSSKEALNGTAAVKAAEDITDAQGAAIYTQDTVVESVGLADGTAVFGAQLAYTGDYYIEITSLPQGYQGIARIYFEITAEGLVFHTSEWDAEASVLTLELHKEATASIPVLMLTDENGAALSGAVFVIKDESGAVIRNAAGYPQYYISYTGTPVMLSGLSDGTYYISQIQAPSGYQIAEDQKFTVPGEPELTVMNARTAQGKTIQVSAETLFGTTVLTAEKEISRYAALFTGEGDSRRRVSAVQELVVNAGEKKSRTVTFAGLTESTYDVLATDEFGDVISEPGLTVADEKVVFASGETQKAVSQQYRYASGSYPEDDFSYTVRLSVVLNVLGQDGSAMATNETFYANIFSDAALTKVLGTEQMVFTLNGAASGTAVREMKMTRERATYYLAETDRHGNPVTADGDFAYAVTYPQNGTGSFTVTCGQNVNLTIQNKLNTSRVRIRLENAAGKQLSGATLAIKDSTGSVIRVLSGMTFQSSSNMMVLVDLLEDGRTYYLTEITAPAGYLPAADVQFTVKAGSTTDVLMVNEPAASTDYSLSVTKQLYVGEHQIYAQDTSSGRYAAEGAYRFYFALFADAARTQKVSNVLSLDVSGFSGSVTFSNLKSGAVYYVAETTQYGEVISSSSALTVRYADSGKVTMSSKSRTMAVQNVYASRPDGYRFTGTLTITKQVQNSAGEASAVTETFYAGIYRNSDYSDTPTIVKLQLQNASSVSARRRILLSGSSDMTYYIAEVDASGTRITNSSGFAYTVSVDQPGVTITKSADLTVTITNKAKSSRATLYITKRVYEGAAKKTVNETFYAGLFKDAGFTELYADPIPLRLSNKSEQTLKLTLNLGASYGATIYIAEVDANGNVIKNQRDFGYEIKIVNSTAAFDQDHLEIQTILLNSVYGTTSADDWNQIVTSTDNNVSGGIYSDNGTVTTGSSGSTSSVQTGDETPLAGYCLLAGASLVLAWGLRRRRRRQA